MLSVVLGGAGFIGSHLVSELSRRGHQVRVLDRNATPRSGVRARAEYVIGDWQDEHALSQCLEGSVDCVYHLIGTVDVRRANTFPAEDLRNTSLASLDLMQACMAARVRRVIYVSSGGAVYGMARQLPIGEDHPTEPISVHGLSKLFVEKYLHIAHILHGLEYHVARCSNVYGEWQDPKRGQGAVNAFLWAILRGEPVHIWGDGTAVRDYVHVKDVARALAALGTTPRKTGVFNVGTGQGVSLNALLKEICQSTNRQADVIYESQRGYDVSENVLDISRITQYIGWQPEISLPDGIRRTRTWLEQARLV